MDDSEFRIFADFRSHPKYGNPNFALRNYERIVHKTQMIRHYSSLSVRSNFMEIKPSKKTLGFWMLFSLVVVVRR